jgi:5-formaminoimidazole-4-carboxamide-1-beta-D-ribofuranosyl 5'-monophosphate synthetase
MNKVRIYLDDVRTPIDKDWIVVRNYEEFVAKVNEIGLENIELISLDHDLGDSAMKEWLHGVVKNYQINYDNITEKTGIDCTKWLVEQWMDGKPVVDVVIHSANAVGSANMMGYINNYRHINRLPQNCVRVRIDHTV